MNAMATCEENFIGYFKAPPNAGPDHKRYGIIDKTAGYASPDGLWFDQSDRLWIQTDVSTSVLNQGDFAALDNNQMLVSDTQSGETRRFLTGPKGCEITGITTTPDGRSLFVNIQQPDETASERFKPDNTSAVSSWPANQFTSAVGGRPRSATVVITHQDGKALAA